MSSTEPVTQVSGGQVAATAGPHATRKESLIKRLANKIR